MESFHQVLRSLWRKRWTGLAAAWVVVLLGGLAVTFMKDSYEASSRVYVNTQTVLKPLMQGLAQQPNMDQQVEMLARTLVSRPNIETLLQDPALAPKPESGEPLTEAQKAAAVTGLMKQIKVMPGSPMTAENGATVNSNLYTISYSDADPQRAQLMVERLLALFMDSMVQSKVRDSQEARQFIDQQIALYETKLQEAEDKLKEFKLRNFGASGASAGDHFSRMSLLADEVSRLQIELRAAEQSRDALRRELASVRPTVTGDTLRAAGSPRLMEIDSRIDADRRQLDELTRRFTDAHPDIIALRESIRRLEGERQQVVRQTLAAGGAAAAGAGNPVFERVRVSLADAEASVASLRTRLASEQARLEQARALGARMPGVEAELARLTRDYEGVQRNYQELVSRRASAAMVENMDETQHMADFRVVEPPRVAPEPVGPTRKTFALMVVVLALVAGALTAWAMGWLQPSFSSERRLEALTGRPVLGRISMALSPDMQAQLRRDHVQFASATGLFFVGCMAWLGWLVLQSRI